MQREYTGTQQRNSKLRTWPAPTRQIFLSSSPLTVAPYWRQRATPRAGKHLVTQDARDALDMCETDDGDEAVARRDLERVRHVLITLPNHGFIHGRPL